MTTFNTATQSVGAERVYDNTHAPEASKADRAAGTIEFKSDGTSKLTIARKGSQSIDIRAAEKAEIAKSAESVSSSPIRLRSRMGAGLSASQAEANPRRALISIHGRETSLQAALAAGWITKGADGNYYDSRVGSPSPGKPEGAEQAPEEALAEDPEDTPKGELPKGFELDEAQRETMQRLHGFADDNPDAVNFAFTHAANSGDLSAEGLVVGLAEQTGMDRSEVEAMIADAETVYTAAANAAVAEVSNVDPALVYSWLRESKPGMAARVVMEAQTGNFTVVKDATNDYINNLSAIDPEAALAADLGPNAKPEMVNGKVAVRINGRLHSWAEAMRYRTK